MMTMTSEVPCVEFINESLFAAVVARAYLKGYSIVAVLPKSQVHMLPSLKRMSKAVLCGTRSQAQKIAVSGLNRGPVVLVSDPSAKGVYTYNDVDALAQKVLRANYLSIDIKSIEVLNESELDLLLGFSRVVPCVVQFTPPFPQELQDAKPIPQGKSLLNLVLGSELQVSDLAALMAWFWTKRKDKKEDQLLQRLASFADDKC